jgi:hypothetical protein
LQHRGEPPPTLRQVLGQLVHAMGLEGLGEQMEPD